MARKTIKRSRRLYSKMDKRKRKTKGKIRRKHRTKKLNKRGGSRFCGSKPGRDPAAEQIERMQQEMRRLRLENEALRQENAELRAQMTNDTAAEQAQAEHEDTWEPPPQKIYYLVNKDNKITHTWHLTDDEIPGYERVAAMRGLRLLNDQYQEIKVKNPFKKGWGCFGGCCGSKPEKEQEMFVFNPDGELVGPIKLNEGDIREIRKNGGRVFKEKK